MITAWLALTALTLFTRLGPLFFGSWLKRQPWIERLAATLPCMILILLVSYNLEHRIQLEGNALPAILGLAACLLCYLWKRQAIISIALGVVIYAVF